MSNKGTLGWAWREKTSSATIDTLSDYYVKVMIVKELDSITFSRFNEIPFPPINPMVGVPKAGVWKALTQSDRWEKNLDKMYSAQFAVTNTDTDIVRGSFFPIVRTRNASESLYRGPAPVPGQKFTVA